MLAAGLFAVNAAEATITFSEQNLANETDVNGTAFSVDNISLVFATGEGSTSPKYYTSGTAVRMYAGNTMTFTIPDGTTVTKLDYVLASQSYSFADDDNAYTASAGTFTADPKTTRTASWTGSVTGGELSIAMNNAKNSSNKWPQFRIVSITVTYSAGVETVCATPKFSVKEGTYYAAQEVTLTCSTDDAKIMYKINDGAETEYTAPIALSEVGTYAVSAYATKDGLENSETATATYVIAAPVEVGSIEDFIMEGESAADGTVFKWTFPVTVTAQMKGDGYGSTYVVDNAGSAMLIYGTQVATYTVGDVIPAGIQGEFANYKGLYELNYPDVDTFGEVTENKGYKPAILQAGNITTADMNKVVYVCGTYTESDSGKTMTDDSGSITVYPQSKWGVTAGTSGESYDLLCAVAVYNSNVQVYPISFDAPGADVKEIAAAASAVRAIEGAVEVAAEGNVAVYNAAGQLVASQQVNGVATIALSRGFYIVRTADATVKVIVK